MQYPFIDGTPCFARIDTANHEIELCVLGDLLYLCLHALPAQTPEEVDPVCQGDGFRKTDLRSADGGLQNLAGIRSWASAVGGQSCTSSGGDMVHAGMLKPVRTVVQWISSSHCRLLNCRVIVLRRK
jgi:hypothetical protein